MRDDLSPNDLGMCEPARYQTFQPVRREAPSRVELVVGRPFCHYWLFPPVLGEDAAAIVSCSTASVSYDRCMSILTTAAFVEFLRLSGWASLGIVSRICMAIPTELMRSNVLV
jgi:hypothetical protein